jgi:hypothetical protein
MLQRSPKVQVLLSREFFPHSLKLLQPGADRVRIGEIDAKNWPILPKNGRRGPGVG